MALDRHAVLDAIKTRLESLTDPGYTVIAGEPLGLPADGSPFCCFWYAGRISPEEGDMTMGNRMNLYQFKVMALWHRTPEMVLLESIEDEVWDGDVQMRAAFWGGWSLGGLISGITITDPVVDYTAFPLQVGPNGRVPVYRSVEFELHIEELEGETIAA